VLALDGVPDPVPFVARGADDGVPRVSFELDAVAAQRFRDVPV
jgi:hypothetical protein